MNLNKLARNGDIRVIYIHVQVLTCKLSIIAFLPSTYLTNIIIYIIYNNYNIQLKADMINKIYIIGKIGKIYKY